MKAKKQVPKAQEQDHQPGHEYKMKPQPDFESPSKDKGKLERKVAIITGGDSGIGKAVALAFVKEGAKVIIGYLNEEKDARDTEKLLKDNGGEVLLIKGDVSEEEHCQYIVNKTIETFGKINIVVNNAAVQYPQDSLENISKEQLEKTFRTNIFPHFFLTKAALPYLNEGDAIICTTSITAYQGSGHLIDYASTKGAILSFIRSLAENLAPKKIRVNGVAPGPIWTPLIPASFDKEHIKEFGKDTPLGRPGQPNEVAPAYVFLASDDASYITGQVIHPNGGKPVGG